MTDEKRELEPTEQELAAQEREAMSLVSANVAVPLNATVAANVLSGKAATIDRGN